MNIFQSLAEEHRLFNRLIDRFEHCLHYEEENAARKEVRDSIRILLPALDRHEEIEHLLFGDSVDAGQKGGQKLLVLIEEQHKRIAILRSDVEALIKDFTRHDFIRMKSSVLLLVDRLRLHFETEEKMLWPSFSSPDSRSIRRCLDHQTQKRVRDMEREMKKYWEVISDYLGVRT